MRKTPVNAEKAKLCGRTDGRTRYNYGYKLVTEFHFVKCLQDIVALKLCQMPSGHSRTQTRDETFEDGKQISS